MEIANKNVLITGGAGFIGSHLVDGYLKEGVNKVIVVDDFSTGSRANLEQISSERLEIFESSILDEERLEKIFRKHQVDIVNHLAAELEVYTGIKDTKKDARLNIEGTLNILNLSLKNKVRKVLFASSGAVYGEAQYIPQDEKHSLEPHWPYGVSKLAAERYCIQYHKLFNLNTTAFRYSIVYGPREWFGRVLTLFIKRVFLENKPPVVFGDGDQIRDFVHVKDVVRAHVRATESDEASGQVFNVSSGKGITVKELAEKVVALSGKKMQIIYDDPREGEASTHQPKRVRLIGELKEFVLHNEKARKLLDWTPKITFDEGLKEEVNWLLGNPQRWDVKPRV